MLRVLSSGWAASSPSKPFTITQTGGLQALQHLLFPTSLEPVYVAIDMEGQGTLMSNFHSGSQTQLGIAILDTRHLNKCDPAKFRSLGIETHCFVSSPSTTKFISSRHPPRALNKCKSRFRWGRFLEIEPQQSDMLDCLEECLPRNRNIILVGHSPQRDLETLASLDFDLNTSVHGILDLVHISQEIELRARWNWRTPSFANLLSQFNFSGLQDGGFHNAGNDAHW